MAFKVLKFSVSKRSIKFVFLYQLVVWKEGKEMVLNTCVVFKDGAYLFTAQTFSTSRDGPRNSGVLRTIPAT